MKRAARVHESWEQRDALAWAIRAGMYREEARGLARAGAMMGHDFTDSVGKLYGFAHQAYDRAERSLQRSRELRREYLVRGAA